MKVRKFVFTNFFYFIKSKNKQSMYGDYIDDKVVEQSGGNMKFGLNQKVLLTEIKLLNGPDAQGVNQQYVEFHFNVNGTNTHARLYPVTKVTIKVDGVEQEITDPNHEEFKKALIQQQAWFTHFFKCFASEEAIKGALAGKKNLTFITYLQAQLALMNPSEAKATPLDLFLEYQWSPSADGKTYLQIPKTRKHGAFICKHIPAEFKEVRNTNGLKYITANNVEHPFVRNEWYVASGFANKSGDAPTGMAMSAPTAGNPFVTGSDVPMPTEPPMGGGLNW